MGNIIRLSDSGVSACPFLAAGRGLRRSPATSSRISPRTGPEIPRCSVGNPPRSPPIVH